MNEDLHPTENHGMWLLIHTLISVTYCADTGIFGEHQVNMMAADALAPFIARSPTTMVSTMQDKQLLVIHKEGFQWFAQRQCWEKYKYQWLKAK